jgi:hypothetical protein
MMDNPAACGSVPRPFPLEAAYFFVVFIFIRAQKHCVSRLLCRPEAQRCFLGITAAGPPRSTTSFSARRRNGGPKVIGPGLRYCMWAPSLFMALF